MLKIWAAAPATEWRINMYIGGLDVGTTECKLSVYDSCGKFIKNEWYITRCACCGVKLRAVIKNGEVVPQHHYCSNCGGEEFVVEKLEQINFIDINFAVLKKRVVEDDNNKICSTTRCWQERTDVQPKLLVQYL